MENSEILFYQTEISTYYGVPVSDVATDTVYERSGRIFIGDSEVQEENLDALRLSLAEDLHLHAQDVELFLDPQTGDVLFSISLSSYEQAVAFSDSDLHQEKYLHSGVDVTKITFEDQTSVSLEIEVDAGDATNDRIQAAWLTEMLLSDFEVTSDGTCF